MSNSSAKANDPGLKTPKKGDKFSCKKCSMQIEVTTECKCKDGDVHFHCCGQEMTMV